MSTCSTPCSSDDKEHISDGDDHQIEETSIVDSFIEQQAEPEIEDTADEVEVSAHEAEILDDQDEPQI